MPKLLRFESTPHPPNHRSNARPLSPTVAAILEHSLAIEPHDVSGDMLRPVKNLLDQLARGFQPVGAGTSRARPLKVALRPDLAAVRARSAAATTAVQESQRDIATAIDELQTLITELRQHQR